MSIGRRRIVRSMTRPSAVTRYLGSGERVLLSTRQHPLAVAHEVVGHMRLLVPLLLVAWGGYGVDLLRATIADGIAAACLFASAAVLVRMAWSVLGWECCRVYVTSENVMVIDGVLNRHMAATPLGKVSELAVRQTLTGRLFNYGALVVDIPGGRPQALHGMSFLPDPGGVYRCVVDTVRSQRTSTPRPVAAATVRARVEDVSSPAPHIAASDEPQTTKLPAIRTFSASDEL